MRVVIVGDDVLLQREFADLLTALGETVVGVAANGQTGLEKARAERPDVVLMDVNLPDMSGFETTLLIKAEMPSVRVVLVTTRVGDADFVARALRCGADENLSKGPSQTALKEVLDGLRRAEPKTPPEKWRTP